MPDSILYAAAAAVWTHPERTLSPGPEAPGDGPAAAYAAAVWAHPERTLTAETEPEAPASLGLAALAALEAAPAILEDAGGRIYPGEFLPQGEPLPALLYAIPKDTRNRDLDGHDGTSTAELVVIVWADHPADAEALAEAAAVALEAMEDAPTLGIVCLSVTHAEAEALVETLDDGGDLDRHAVATTYRIRYQTPTA